MKKLLLAIIFSAVSTFAAEPLTITISEGCEALLAKNRPRQEAVWSRILSGTGRVTFWTLDEWKEASLSPRPSSFLKQTAEGLWHQAVVGTLPVAAKHFFPTLATTYLYQPSPSLRTTESGDLFFEWTATGAEPTIHTIILGPNSTDMTLMHEAIHLRDLNRIQKLVQTRLQAKQGLLIPLPIFKIVTELIAYKESRPLQEPNLVGEVNALLHDIHHDVRSLDGDCLAEILDAFELESFQRAKVELYVRSEQPTPNVAVVIDILVRKNCVQPIQL